MKHLKAGVPIVAQWLVNPTSTYEDMGSIPDLAWWVGDRVAMSWSVGFRCGSDPALLWLWNRHAATVPIESLAWEPPYAAGTHPPPKKRKNLKHM